MWRHFFELLKSKDNVATCQILRENTILAIKASQHMVISYNVISVTFIKSYVLLIKTCSGNQAVTYEKGNEKGNHGENECKFKKVLRDSDRQMSAIHYRLPNDFFSASLIKRFGASLLHDKRLFSNHDTSILPLLLRAIHSVSPQKTNPSCRRANLASEPEAITREPACLMHTSSSKHRAGRVLE